VQQCGTRRPNKRRVGIAATAVFSRFELQFFRKLFVSRSTINIAAWLGILGVIAVAAYSAYLWSAREGYAHLDNVASHQLDMYVAGLESELGKHEYLPSLMELDPDVLSLLDGKSDSRLADTVNRRLSSLNVRAGSLAIFVMDTHGIVRASSNWYQPGSFVGRDFSALPYFSDAMLEGQARFFSPNTVLDSPEYYFVQPVRHHGATKGLAVVKISLAPIESTWTASTFHSESEKFLIIDDKDDVIISSVPEWKYNHTTLVSSILRAKLARPDSDAPETVRPFGMAILQALDHGNYLVRLPAPNATSPGKLYVTHERYMVRTGWRLVTLSDASDVRLNALHTAIGAGALAAFISLFALYLVQRRRAIASRLAAREALQQAHDGLERKVAERTAELHSMNQNLVREVADRKRAEQVLREAQDELIQASKLALLGQMSTGITHEINQPLTALRSLTHNTRLLLERGQTDRISRNLHSIAAITERMGRITAQLKSFARKAPLTIKPVLLSRSVENALLLLENRIHSEHIVMQIDVAPGLHAHCDENRLEQVLINLIANACDAMKDAPVKEIRIRAWAADGRALIRIADSGPGISASAMARLFEPFFSTKPQGEGLGLGLAISSGIVQEFGGTLRADCSEGGAAFEFDLKLTKEDNHV
jgi:two-component system C4-dicarboxylate transport sensor histidine kinase DctB